MIKEKRNYGIDLLRIISMIFIVVLHFLGHGGVLSNVAANTNQYKVAWAIEIFVYCAVDIFALISGYVSWNKKIKLKNYINLWLQVVFYSLLAVLIFQIINPNTVILKDGFRSVLPVTTNVYWYFTAYTGLFLLKPLLDKGIQACSKEYLKKVFLLIIIGFSIFDIFTKTFSLQDGYSVIWLVILYICGAIINKCEIGKKIKWYYIIIIAFILYMISFTFFIANTYDFHLLNKFLGIKINNSIFINYTSPTILGIAILYMIGVSRIHFNIVATKMITFLSPSVFAVYLLNDHYLVRNNFIFNRFQHVANESIIAMLFEIIGFSILFFIVSILIDKFRLLLFKILKIDSITERVTKSLKSVFNKIASKL